MIRYTTPALPLDVEGIDLTQQQDVYVSLKQGTTYLEKRNDDLSMTVETVQSVTTTHIIMTLSQEETAQFKESLTAGVQVNWINSLNLRDATDIVGIDIRKNLLERVIEYGD